MGDGACVAVVARWSGDEREGVLEAEQLPGGCRVHSTVIDAEDLRVLAPGSQVAVWWSRFPRAGCPFRADRVLPTAGAGHAEPISDGEMLAAMEASVTGDVEILSATEVSDGSALLRLRAAAGGAVWAVEVPLPSSRRLKPWLYCTPDDAVDAARMLGVLLDEEVVTGAVHSARRDERGRLVLTAYGFEQADPGEHERLRRAAGDRGWWDGRTEAGPFGSRESG